MNIGSPKRKFTQDSAIPIVLNFNDDGTLTIPLVLTDINITTSLP